MKEYVNLYLLKAENPEAYKKLAEKGILIGHNVKIGGQQNRPDIGIPYHATVKFFDPEKDQPKDIHGVARELNFIPPDPKNTKIEPTVFKDRAGNDVYAIKLHGEHAEQIKGHNKKFSHMGHPANYEFQPHVSVDKATWDNIVNSKAQTAHEAGIEFGPAQLKQGPNVLATYHHTPNKKESIADKHKVLHSEPKKMAASETSNLEPLEKGVLKQIGTAAAMAGALGLASPVQEGSGAMSPKHHSNYSSQKMLNTISQVESSGGKFANHRMLGGMHGGDSAYGKYGLTPIVIRETIHMNPDLKRKHKKALNLKGNDLTHYMQDNPELEDAVATKHLSRLEHHFGKDPAKIGYAWLEGINGTYKANKENKDINSHWHVKKIKDAYSRGK